jgi:hypothetical protein
VRTTLSVALAILALSATATATPFRDDKRGLSLDVPAAYHDVPSPSPQILHTWARGEAGEPGYAAIVLQGMGGTIGRDKLDRAIVEKAARATVASSGLTITGFDYDTVRWQSLELEVMIARVTGGDRDGMTIAVQIPLAAEAVQLMVAGAADGEAQMRADLTHVLGSLHGRSNWLTDAERSEKLGVAVGLGLGTLTVAVLLWRRRRRRRVAAA